MLRPSRFRARLIATAAVPIVLISFASAAVAGQPAAPRTPLAAVAPADAGDDAIIAKYRQLGGDGPLSGIITLSNGTKYATFPKWGTTVAITWNYWTGAHWISGAIAAEWIAATGKAAWGGLVADQTTTTGGPRAGAAAAFEYGSMYYSDTTGARFLNGEVLKKYWQLGNVTGIAKFPTSDVAATPTGDGDYADFEGSVRI